MSTSAAAAPQQPSDHELDLAFQREREGQQRFRPSSTVAQAFENQLNDVFLIDDSLDTLNRNINRKKQSVSYQSSELAALEARIAAAEKLLEEKKREADRRGRGEGSGSETEKSEGAGEGGYVVVDKQQQERQRYQPTPPPPPPEVPAEY